MVYDLIDLQLYLHVIDTGSITRGAERTHLSLASASARIKAMEHALGSALLTRHRRGVVPTSAGWLLANHARVVINQISRMRTELADYADGIRVNIALMANTSATETLFPAVITEFLKAHPEIDVEIMERPSPDIVAAVKEGRSELGAVADTIDLRGLECTLLRPDPLVVIAPPGHDLATRDRISFSEVLRYSFVGFAEGNPLQDHLNGRAHPLGLRPRYRARLPGTEAICAAVAAGVGIAVVPALAVRRWRRDHEVHTLDLTNLWAQRSLLLCSRTWTDLSAPAAALARHLTDTG
jgi:DNA-binding transcriptional LysR family regulator